MKRKIAVIITIAAALIATAMAFAETAPTFVANGVTAGKYGVWGNYINLTGTPVATSAGPWDVRLTLLHVRAGASGVTFNARRATSITGTWSDQIVLPIYGFASSDTTLSLGANEKGTFVIPGLYDIVVVTAGGGDLWGE